MRCLVSNYLVRCLLLVVVILFLVSCPWLARGQNHDALDNRPTKIGIVNGMATYLPKPQYPRLPLDACASGSVSVQIQIGKNGRVRQAIAISGNALFRPSAVRAARLARFRNIVDGPPMQIDGILIYNFPSSPGCKHSSTSNFPLCNSLATTLPNPEFDPRFANADQSVIYVDIRIGKTGSVISAEAFSSVPELKSVAEAAALKGKFQVTKNRGIPVEVSCRIVYRLPKAVSS